MGGSGFGGRLRRRRLGRGLVPAEPHPHGGGHEDERMFGEEIGDALAPQADTGKAGGGGASVGDPDDPGGAAFGGGGLLGGVSRGALDGGGGVPSGLRHDLGGVGLRAIDEAALVLLGRDDVEE